LKPAVFAVAKKKSRPLIFFFSPLASRRSLGLLVLAVLDLLGLRGLLGFPAFLELVLELLRVLVVGPRVRTTIERARREKLENRKRDALVFVSGEGEQLEHARRGMRR
jgi:hypothetical protein